MTKQEFKSLKYGDVLKDINNDRGWIVQGFIGDVIVVSSDSESSFYNLQEINLFDYELVKPDVIDWDKPQLVYFNDIVVLTTGYHYKDRFAGVSITGEYEFRSKWEKSLFKPYKKPFI
jgi:hypothetical protein